MNTNSYLTAAVATEHINSLVREAQTQRLVAEARRTPRPSRTVRPKVFGSRTRRSWFSRPATA